MLTMVPERRRAHSGQHGLETSQGAEQVDVHHLGVPLDRRFLDAAVSTNTGVVDEHVVPLGLVLHGAKPVCTDSSSATSSSTSRTSAPASVAIAWSLAALSTLRTEPRQ